MFSKTLQLELRHQHALNKQRDWFKRESFPVFFPQHHSSPAVRTSQIQISDQKILQLSTVWHEIESDYFTIVQRFHLAKLYRKYRCHVSAYGPEGMFQSPTTVFLRLRTKRDEARACETLGHELIHLMFDHVLSQKKLTYAECEGMVDALITNTALKEIFPKYERQPIGRVNRGILNQIVRS